MRKIQIIILFLLLMFTSGCNTSINSSVYISSIGFEVNEDGKLVTYFLSNPLTDISRSSEDKTKEAQYIKLTTDSVYDAFLEASQSLLSPLNFLHVKTIIFSEKCFGSKYIMDFFNYIKSVRFISYNFYVFATISKIEDIYKFKNPEQISYQYSILSSPDLLSYSEFGIEKLHFLDFANDYFNPNRYLHIPLIVINDSWGKNITLEVDGFLCYEEPITLYRNSEYKGMLYLYDKQYVLLHDEEDVYRITNYRVNKYKKNNTFIFSISYEQITIFGEGSRDKFEKKLAKEIKKYLDSYITNQDGLYLIKFYNYLNTKSLNVYNYEIEIIYKG